MNNFFYLVLNLIKKGFFLKLGKLGNNNNTRLREFQEKVFFYWVQVSTKISPDIVKL